MFRHRYNHYPVAPEAHPRPAEVSLPPREPNGRFTAPDDPMAGLDADGLEQLALALIEIGSVAPTIAEYNAVESALATVLQRIDQFGAT